MPAARRLAANFNDSEVETKLKNQSRQVLWIVFSLNVKLRSGMEISYLALQFMQNPDRIFTENGRRVFEVKYSFPASGERRRNY